MAKKEAVIEKPAVQPAPVLTSPADIAARNRENVRSGWTEKLAQEDREAKIKAEQDALTAKEQAETAEKSPAELAQEADAQAAIKAKSISILESFRLGKPVDEPAKPEPVDKEQADDKSGEVASQEAAPDESLLAKATELGLTRDEAIALAPELLAKITANLGKKEAAQEKPPEYQEINPDLSDEIDPEIAAKVKELVNAQGKKAFEVEQRLKAAEAELLKAKNADLARDLDSFMNGLAAEPEWEAVFGRGSGQELYKKDPAKFKNRLTLANEAEAQIKAGFSLAEAKKRAFNLHFAEKALEIKTIKGAARLKERQDQTLGRPTPTSAAAKSVKDEKQQTMRDKARNLLDRFMGKK